MTELQEMLQAQRRKTVRNAEVEDLVASLLYHFAPVARAIEHTVLLFGAIPCGHAPWRKFL